MSYSNAGGDGRTDSSREMSATSDLDLIFVYDIPPGIEASDGRQPLAPTQYYTRLSAKMVTALTAHTNEGPLYEVDMRLRPSGRAGPLANSLDGFEAYHAQSAWTWEHMALCRARVIHGPAGLVARLADIVRSTLCRPRDPAGLLRDVADIAGLPLLLLAAGAVSFLAVPLAHAMSRAYVRSADRFALTLTRNPEAFISAMRRLGNQNLAEEHPSKVVQWLFYSHPPMRERIAAAQAFAHR